MCGCEEYMTRNSAILALMHHNVCSKVECSQGYAACSSFLSCLPMSAWIPEANAMEMSRCVVRVLCYIAEKFFELIQAMSLCSIANRSHLLN